MKKVILTFCSIMFCFCLTACNSGNTNENKQAQYETPRSDSTQQTDDADELETLTMIDLIITVGDKSFSAKLYDNQTTQALVEQLPLTVNMDELNGNEKFYFLSNTLPTAAERAEQIKTGDFMLYGDSCLVLFYDTFSSSYSYTLLGYIEDTTGFTETLGSGSVQVTFSTK